MDRKILVISDLKESAENTLNTAAKLSKTLNKNLYFLSVQKPVEVVGQDSQLSALRNLNYSQSKAIDKIKTLVKPYQKEGVQIDFKHSIGNLKNEILAHIKVIQPEIIVLGKRKSKTLNITGDKLTDFILKNHKGIVILANQNTPSTLDGKYSLAILSEALSEKGQDLVNKMGDSNHNAPIIKLDVSKKISFASKTNSNSETMSLLKEQYNLVFIDRNKHQKNLKKVISNVDCSLVLTD